MHVRYGEVVAVTRSCVTVKTDDGKNLECFAVGTFVPTVGSRVEAHFDSTANVWRVERTRPDKFAGWGSYTEEE